MIGYRIQSKYTGASRFILAKHKVNSTHSSSKSDNEVYSLLDSADGLLTESEVRYYRNRSVSYNDSFMAN